MAHRAISRPQYDVPFIDDTEAEDVQIFPLSPIHAHRQLRRENGLDIPSPQPLALPNQAVKTEPTRQKEVTNQRAAEDMSLPQGRQAVQGQRSPLCDTLPIFGMASNRTASDGSWLLNRDELDTDRPVLSSQMDALYQFQLPTLRQLDALSTHDTNAKASQSSLRSLTLTSEALQHLNAVAGYLNPTSPTAESAALASSMSDLTTHRDNYHTAMAHDPHNAQDSTIMSDKENTAAYNQVNPAVVRTKRTRRNSSPAKVYSQVAKLSGVPATGSANNNAVNGSSLSQAPSCETPNSSQDCFMLLPLPPMDSETLDSSRRNAAAWDSLSRVLPDGSQLSRAVVLQHQVPFQNGHTNSVQAVLGWLGGSTEEEALGLGATLRFGHYTPSEGSVLSMPLSSHRGPIPDSLPSYRVDDARGTSGRAGAAPPGSSLAPWALDVLFDSSDSDGEEGGSNRPSPNRLTPSASMKSGWLKSSMLQSTMSTQESLTKPMPVDGTLDPIPLIAPQQPTTLTTASSISTLLDLKQELQRLSWLDMSNPIVEWLAPSPRNQTALNMFSTIQMSVVPSSSRQSTAPPSPASTIMCPLTAFSPGRRGTAPFPPAHQPLQPSTPLNPSLLNHQLSHLIQSVHHFSSRPSTPGSSRVPPSPSTSLITPRSTTIYLPSLPDTPLSSARSWRRCSRHPSLREHATALPLANATTMSVPLHALHELLQELHQVSHGGQCMFTPRQTPGTTPLTTPRTGIRGPPGTSPLSGFSRFGPQLAQLPEGSASASPDSLSRSSLQSSPQQSAQLHNAGSSHKEAEGVVDLLLQKKKAGFDEAYGGGTAPVKLSEADDVDQPCTPSPWAPPNDGTLLDGDKVCPMGVLDMQNSKELSVDVSLSHLALGAFPAPTQQTRPSSSPSILLSPNLLTPERSVEDWSGPNMDHDSPLTVHEDSSGMGPSTIAVVRTPLTSSTTSNTITTTGSPADMLQVGLGVGGTADSVSSDLKQGVDATLTAFGLVRDADASKLSTGGSLRSQSVHEGRVQQLLSLHQKVLEARTLQEKQQYSRAIDQLLQQGLATATWAAPLISPHSTSPSTPNTTTNTPDNTNRDAPTLHTTHSSTLEDTASTVETHTVETHTPFMVPPDAMQGALETDHLHASGSFGGDVEGRTSLLEGRLPSMQPWPAYSARAPLGTCPEGDVRMPLEPQTSGREPVDVAQGLERTDSGRVVKGEELRNGRGAMKADDVFLPLKSPKEGPVIKPDVPKLNLLSVSMGSSATADRYHSALSSRSSDTTALSSFRSVSSAYLSTCRGPAPVSQPPSSPLHPTTTSSLHPVIMQTDIPLTDATSNHDIEQTAPGTKLHMQQMTREDSALCSQMPYPPSRANSSSLNLADFATTTDQDTTHTPNTETQLKTQLKTEIAAVQESEHPGYVVQAGTVVAHATGLHGDKPVDVLAAKLIHAHGSNETLASVTADESTTSTPTSIPSMRSSSAPVHSVSSSAPDDTPAQPIMHNRGTSSNSALVSASLGLGSVHQTSVGEELVHQTSGAEAAKRERDVAATGAAEQGEEGCAHMPDQQRQKAAAQREEPADSEASAGLLSPVATSSPHLHTEQEPNPNTSNPNTASGSDTAVVLNMLMRKSTELEDLLKQVRRLKDEPQKLSAFTRAHMHTPPLPPSVQSLSSAATGVSAPLDAQVPTELSSLSSRHWESNPAPSDPAAAPHDSAASAAHHSAEPSNLALPHQPAVALNTVALQQNVSTAVSPTYAVGCTSLSCDVLLTPPPSGPPTPQPVTSKAPDTSVPGSNSHVSSLHNKATLRRVSRTDASSTSASASLSSSAQQGLALLASTPTAAATARTSALQSEQPAGTVGSVGQEQVVGLQASIQPGASVVHSSDGTPEVPAGRESTLENVAMWLASESNCIGAGVPSDGASEIQSLDSEVFTKISWDGVSERGEAAHGDGNQSGKKSPVGRTVVHEAGGTPVATEEMNRNSNSPQSLSDGRSRIQVMSERVAQLRARRMALGQGKTTSTTAASSTPGTGATAGSSAQQVCSPPVDSSSHTPERSTTPSASVVPSLDRPLSPMLRVPQLRTQAPVQSAPARSGLAQSAPAQSAPARSGVVQPALVQSASAQSAPARSGLAQSAPTQSAPIPSTPARSAAVQPVPVQSAPAQSATAQSAPVQSAPARSATVRQSWPVQTEAAVQSIPEVRPPRRSSSNIARVHLSEFLTPAPEPAGAQPRPRHNRTPSGRILLKDFLM